MKSEKINMMEFLGKKIENRKKIGTPTKKVKLNEDNESVNSDWDIPFGNLLFIKNISKTESSMMTNNKQESTFKISEFSLGNNPQFGNEIKENDPFYTNRKQSHELMEEQKDFKLPPKLNKRMNSVERCPTNQYDSLLTELNLRKHNSTFPVVDFAGLENEDEFGQNIYLNQLLTLKAKISLTDANNENREILRNMKNNQERNQENRLEQDYEIKENLGRYQPNKEGFICLNKLQKIFYYVKKTSLTRGNTFTAIHQSPLPTATRPSNLQTFLSNLTTSRRQTLPLESTSLIRSQIKLYNRDSESHLVRFYQEWIQKNELFMIYELGSYSIADKILSGQKLPESEVWAVLYDSAEALKWVYDCGKVHMNLKPGNVVKCRGKYKLADPIVEKEYVQGHIQQVNSSNQQFYLAPQLSEFQSFIQGIDFSKCEIYSLGLIILENITTLPRSMKNCAHSELKAHFKRQLHGYSSYLKRLLLRMIDTNYKKRPTFEELLCSNIEESRIEKGKLVDEIKFKRANSV